jgi:hypothetical protein
MRTNPFLVPMWLMLAVAIVVSWLIDIPYHTLVGLWAWGPWAMTVIALFLWERRRTREGRR